MKKSKKSTAAAKVTSTVQTARGYDDRFSVVNRYTPLCRPELKMYAALRESVPIIDAAIGKIVRLVGNFDVACSDKTAQTILRRFLSEVQCGPAAYGIGSFIACTIDQLLTYGTAVGEIVLDSDGRVAALYNADLESLELQTGKGPLDTEIYALGGGGEKFKVSHPERICVSALNPSPDSPFGTSMLKGLPFVSGILLKIFNCVGVNFDRLGNLRFAVTYRPANSGIDPGLSENRAEEIASAWSDAMSDTGNVRDFIAVGDVDIKVIGSDAQMMDIQVPVRSILEQIVAKIGLPPFLLGLCWSSTERMSTQQSDILTSELEYYRHLLSSVILKICRAFLRGEGYDCEPEISWSNISLQDETELAKARLCNAQASQIEAGLRGEKQ